MEERSNEVTRPVNPRRRKRTKWEIFKEAYLPIVIAAAALAMIVVIIVGSITRAAQRKQAQEAASIAASEAQEKLSAEARSISAQAETLAAAFDYEGAIALIDGFSGDLADYPVLSQLKQQYEGQLGQLVVWDDPSKVANLSFHSLIVDAQRAFSFPEYGSSNKQHYVTTTEFSSILQQLYDNGYVLVSADDIYTTQTAEDGTVQFTSKVLRLPADKKPVMLTQTNVNYYTYLSDSDGDKEADKGGAGFASKMVVGADGKVDCEYIDADGQVLTGAYDLVPILDDFIDAHPDFSYNGAKATIAITGYDGIFGYRTNKDAESYFGTAVYDQSVADATAVADALKASGYKIACYTYSNTGYGSLSTQEIQDDVTSWMNEVAPIVGQADTIVYAQKSDITDSLIYSGEKFDVLANAGFKYYLGFCSDGIPWTIVDDTYVRQGRILVTGDSLSSNSGWFAGLFDASAVLDSSARGS